MVFAERGPTGVIAVSGTALPVLTLNYDSANKAITGSIDLTGYAKLSNANNVFAGNLTANGTLFVGSTSIFNAAITENL